MHLQNGTNTICSSSSEEDLGKIASGVEWKECKWWENKEENIEHLANYCSSSDQLKVLQFNILNDDLVNETLTEKIATHKRFDYIAHKLLPNSNADVICLNEVGNGFLKKLLDECSDGWMKDGKYFYISHLDQERFFDIPSNKVIPEEQQKVSKKNAKKAVDDATQMTVEKASFVNLVISRIPFTQSHNYYYQNDLVYSRRPANVITLANQMVMVNLHLKAYKECHPIRKKQLKCIYSLFRIPRVDFKMHEENKESSQSSTILEDESRFTYHFGIEELNPKSLLFTEKKEFSEIYENVKYVLMCGDYNLNHDFEEHMISDYDLEDVYAKLYPEKIGSKTLEEDADMTE
ncbi:predicted protein [Naegleria gruberi]|uniref:Predicted protein n=1 Tax=Naegleria gruberi TaxID=5762 RepID=D2VG44_NAEGR|nr:uncharacterized protein NAEGRDRAFT_67847 [Naegleria gruberi]EFC44205.1 predicted protein [Naegleria gruberi]|eukprot:XP_002676949.1 predicted protein [Naegleria gruberi strain NEG-M]